MFKLFKFLKIIIKKIKIEAKLIIHVRTVEKIVFFCSFHIYLFQNNQSIPPTQLLSLIFHNHPLLPRRSLAADVISIDELIGFMSDSVALLSDFSP